VTTTTTSRRVARGTTTPITRTSSTTPARIGNQSSIIQSIVHSLIHTRDDASIGPSIRFDRSIGRSVHRFDSIDRSIDSIRSIGPSIRSIDRSVHRSIDRSLRVHRSSLSFFEIHAPVVTRPRVPDRRVTTHRSTDIDAPASRSRDACMNE
jgi:hypothetical protein